MSDFRNLVRHDICPRCGSDDTIHWDDWIKDEGLTIRHCDGCGKKYKVRWKAIAIGTEVIDE